MRQDSPSNVPPSRGFLRQFPVLCRILALGFAGSMLAVGPFAQAAPRGTGGSLYPQETALDALAGGDASQRGGQICPQPPGVLQICDQLAPTQCVTGTPGEECWPISVFHVPAGPVAIECTCAGPGSTCGPVTVVIDPVAGLRYSCESLCSDLTDECLIHVNGTSSGVSSIGGTQVTIDDVITCECPPPPPTYENWVIADDFCLDGCDRCQCDVNGDGVCDPGDIQFWNNCSAIPPPAGCITADVNCDGLIDQADLIIIDCMVAGGTEAECCPGAGNVIDRVRWYGSYFDSDFEPPTDGTPPLRRPDSWLIAIHTDIPATSCPPPPAGTKGVDWCGKLEACPDGPGVVFRPNGSAFTYNFSDPGLLLFPFLSEPEIRICGHDDTSLSGCPSALSGVVIDAVGLCESKVSRPDRLIAQWVIPDPLVTVDPTGKAGWDAHRIFCYTADLTCLVHDFSDPGEIDSMGNFHPVPGKTYWISIQAAVGHTVDAACNEITTGQSVSQDYWGWHTTPPGHQHKDDAYMGQLAMGCQGEWLYNWMSHLHSSQPPFVECADDPTKSIDMAFYLIDADGFCGGDPTQPCQTDAQCDPAAGLTCDTTEIVHWCQPVNPGTPIIATPVPVPNDAIDELALTIADVQVNLDFIPVPLNLHFEGPTVVWRGIEHEDIGRSHCKGCWATEMVSMDLAGTDPSLGDCTLRVTPLGSSGQDGVRSTGSTTPSATGCQCMDADWDLNVEVECEIGPDGRPFVVVVETPIHLTAQIYEVPPMNVTFVSDPQPVVLIDRATLQPIGTIKSATHFIPYKGGVNVHSDVDWANTPTEECCEPLPDGSDCEQVVCPDPNEECVPVEYECSTFCAGTADPCTTDADCGGVTCDTRCVVTDCDCQLPDKCHAFADTTLPDPVFCVNSCPPGQICERVEIDLDGDGVPDRFRCRCVEDDPLFCPLPAPSGVVDPCQQLQVTDCITDVFNGEECLPRFIVNASGTGFVDGCDCFTPGTDECGPIDLDPFTGDITCSGVCPPFIPGDCVIIVDGTSLGISTTNLSNPAIPDGATLWCDCHPVDPDGACCIDADSDGIDEFCIITTDTDCAAQGGTYHGASTVCGTFGACCLDTDGDGRSETCIEMDSTCCEDSGGTFLGTGAVCEGDLNGNGIDDACDCDVLPGERIILRSGNGAVGGFDTAITVWQGVATLPLSLFPFTAVDFFHACVLGPANVIAPNPAWLAGSAGVLPSDPLAQWIGPNPNSAGGVGIIGQPASGLFCQPFDVCCPDITTATITISFAADDQVGDIPFGPNNVGVYINGTAQPGFWGVGFGSEITLSGPAFGLASGPNNLQVYLRDVHAVASGLIYSVTIDVDCALEACCFPDGTCEDLDPCCCRDLGGLPQGAGSDCTTADCGNGDDFCPLPSTGGVVDPCDARQLTDCFSDSANQLCLPICYENEVQLDGTVVPVATKCDCIEGDECGPVKTQNNGVITEFVCDPTFCPDPLDECWIHINGSPIGASSIATSAVAIGSEVKCKCAHEEGIPCPTPLPPTDDICGTLQSTQCLDGVVNEFCRPVCVEVEQVGGGLGVVATLCECVDKESCGPVTVTDLPNPPGGVNLACNPSLCLDPLETCQVHINGSPTGQTSIDVDNLSPGTEVKCKCADEPFDPCPTEQSPAIDPCGPLQATDCGDGVDGQVCRPICVDVNLDLGLPVITATSCDCVDGDECGPVRVLGFLLICDPTNCPTPGEQCSIHINGSPTGQLTYNGASLTANTEVKCKCSAVVDDPCPTEQPPALDLCGARQATDCIDGVAGETCLALCVEVVNDPVVGPMPVATECDCISGDECGPVRKLDDGITVTLICEPNVCQDPTEECQIHLNGSPTGSNSIDAATVPDNTEVKCKCSSTPNDPCPTPLPPSDDPCGLLQPTDCEDGLAGELCVPICLVIEQDAGGLVPVATLCDCREGGCGPIIIDDFPGGTTGLRCNPDPCPTAGTTCEPHVNGVAQGASSVIVGDLVPGDEVKCQCPTTIVPPAQAPAPHNILKNRYISVDPSGGGINPSSHHIRVTVNSSLVPGQVGAGPWWAGAPQNGNDTCSTPCLSIVTQTKPGVEPDWTGCSVVHLTGCPIIPTTTYGIAAESGNILSAEALFDTQAKPGVKWHADSVGFFNGLVWTDPNGATNIDDAVACIKTFQNCAAINAAHLSRVDLASNLPGDQINLVCNINDVFVAVLGFQGFTYPNPDLTTCP